MRKRGPKIFFTSDYHFNDDRVRFLGHRPFKSLGHMEHMIIKKHNQRVQPHDIVFHLGDFAFASSEKTLEYISKLNGNLIFVKGNHEKRNGLKTCIDYIVISRRGYKVKLIHTPGMGEDYYDYNFCGHIHGEWAHKIVKKNGRDVNLINVGVDVNNFEPKTFEELIKGFNKWIKGGDNE